MALSSCIAGLSRSRHQQNAIQALGQLAERLGGSAQLLVLDPKLFDLRFIPGHSAFNISHRMHFPRTGTAISRRFAEAAGLRPAPRRGRALPV
jgi:hypothetical protein